MVVVMILDVVLRVNNPRRTRRRLCQLTPGPCTAFVQLAQVRLSTASELDDRSVSSIRRPSASAIAPVFLVHVSSQHRHHVWTRSPVRCSPSVSICPPMA
jgi:hypothetical protein